MNKMERTELLHELSIEHEDLIVYINVHNKRIMNIHRKVFELYQKGIDEDYLIKLKEEYVNRKII